MQVVKVVGAIVGIFLLTMSVIVAIGMIGHSLIGCIVVCVGVLVVGAVAWGRRMDATGSTSAYLRLVDKGLTLAHDRLLQDDDAMRDYEALQRQRHRPDLE